MPAYTLLGLLPWRLASYNMLQAYSRVITLTRARSTPQPTWDGPPKGRRASTDARPICWGRHDGRGRDDLEDLAPPPFFFLCFSSL